MVKASSCRRCGCQVPGLGTPQSHDVLLTTTHGSCGRKLAPGAEPPPCSSLCVNPLLSAGAAGPRFRPYQLRCCKLSGAAACVPCFPHPAPTDHPSPLLTIVLEDAGMHQRSC